jgi:hypothetical protein
MSILLTIIMWLILIGTPIGVMLALYKLACWIIEKIPFTEKPACPTALKASLLNANENQSWNLK